MRVVYRQGRRTWFRRLSGALAFHTPNDLATCLIMRSCIRCCPNRFRYPAGWYPLRCPRTRDPREPGATPLTLHASMHRLPSFLFFFRGGTTLARVFRTIDLLLRYVIAPQWRFFFLSERGLWQNSDRVPRVDSKHLLSFFLPTSFGTQDWTSLATLGLRSKVSRRRSLDHSVLSLRHVVLKTQSWLRAPTKRDGPTRYDEASKCLFIWLHVYSCSIHFVRNLNQMIPIKFVYDK